MLKKQGWRATLAAARHDVQRTLYSGDVQMLIAAVWWQHGVAAVVHCIADLLVGEGSRCAAAASARQQPAMETLVSHRCSGLLGRDSCMTLTHKEPAAIFVGCIIALWFMYFHPS
jgi:hypothetical protein